VDTKRERKAMMITVRGVAIPLASKVERVVIRSRNSKQEEKIAE